jgi:DNA-binding response OmpR family regulator
MDSYGWAWERGWGKSMSSSQEPDKSGMDTSILKGAHVLVVEDAWHVAEAMRSALERVEIHVIGPTATIAEARRLVAAQKPELALVDVNLKQETACDLIDELHEQGVPVIVVSGYAVPPVAMEKAAAFVQKPFSGRELMEAMCAIVGRLH